MISTITRGKKRRRGSVNKIPEKTNKTLCNNCIAILYDNLSPEAILIIKTLVAGVFLNQSEITKAAWLSVSVARDALNELKGAMMVETTVKGRGIYYSLSEGMIEAIEEMDAVDATEATGTTEAMEWKQREIRL